MSDPRGRQPIGVAQPPDGALAYPFASPSADVQALLADFWLEIPQAAVPFAPPFRIAWLYGFGDVVNAPPGWAPSPSHDRDLLILDANGQTVFDSTIANYQERAWNSRLAVAEWGGGAADGVCRVLWHTAWPGDPEQTYDLNLVPENGVLVGRTYSIRPSRVESLTAVASRFSGSVEIKSGYNVTLERGETAATEGGRRVTRVVVNAVAGSGEGRKPGCEETEVLVRRINRVSPDSDGNFLLQAEDCHSLGIPVEISGTDAVPIAEGTVKLRNDCTPCCKCADYVKTYKALKKLWDRWQDAATALEAARDGLRDNVAAFERRRACVASNILRLGLVVEAGCRVGVSAVVANGSGECVTSLQIRYDVAYFVGTTETSTTIAPTESFYMDETTGMVRRRQVPSVVGSRVTFLHSQVSAGRAAASGFRLSLNGCLNGDSVRVTVSVVGLDLEPVVQSVAIFPDCDAATTTTAAPGGPP